jgi:hypothetical protein
MVQAMTENIVARYWRAYGGKKALIRSPYLWAALFITVLLYPEWSTAGWWHDVLTVMRNLLGFTLGGYAMWIAIGDDEFRLLISGEEDDGKPSPYMEVNATFVHFIILQIISIIFFCAVREDVQLFFAERAYTLANLRRMVATCLFERLFSLLLPLHLRAAISRSCNVRTIASLVLVRRSANKATSGG